MFSKWADPLNRPSGLDEARNSEPMPHFCDGLLVWSSSGRQASEKTRSGRIRASSPSIMKSAKAYALIIGECVACTTIHGS